MAPGRRMCPIQPILLAFVAFSSLISLASGVAKEVLSAPNLLRVGTTENIFVEVQDRVEEWDVPVTITVWTFPVKNYLTNTSVILRKTQDFQGFAKITIPATGFSVNAKKSEYVRLEAKFPNRELQKVVLVNFQSGFIFIQTDKTIYTPEKTVNFRVFGVNPGMEPAETEGQQKTPIDIAFVNPSGITQDSRFVSLTSGLYTGTFTIPKIVLVGQWKMVAKYHSNPQQSFTAEFEIKEYVLPNFEVNLKSRTSFFYVDAKELTIDITAKYLFDKTVEGTAYAIFGVMLDGVKTGIPSSLAKVPINRGAGSVTLMRENLKQTFKDVNTLVGNSMYVCVSVLTESGSEMVEAELRSIPIVKSPYTIRFRKTPTYFKPGMAFDVAVEVLNPDKTPAAGVPVEVTPGGDSRTTTANGIAWLNINPVTSISNGVVNDLQIEVTTKDTGISSERQTSVTMTSSPYSSPTNNYIHIEVDKEMLQLGKDMRFLLLFKQEDSLPNDITYLILSRGQLVDHGRYKRAGQKTLKGTIEITKNMLPSFRMVVYYHDRTSNELISDSVWLDVKDSCMGSLKLEILEPQTTYKPGDNVNLKITGDPGATVGLVAVDKAVFILNSKNRLTQKKIWQNVEKSDIGCTPGGGKNGMSVFFDAGLLFESSVSSGLPSRTAIKCSSPSRTKRAPSIVEVRNNLVTKFEDKLQRECCLDGMKVIPVYYSCQRRSEYIVDGQACVDAFLECCKEMVKQQAQMKEENLQLARSYENTGYTDTDLISYRTKFDESWLWKNIKLPFCPQNQSNCLTTSIELPPNPLQDTITTWQFIGISLSKTHGICVAEQLEVIARKDFFIKLQLPYNVVREEQVEIRAILYNYSPSPITVHLEMEEHKSVCSAAYKRGKFQQDVRVGAQTTRSVPFVIIPMEGDKVPIGIKAYVKGTYISDAVRKDLRVVPKGVLQKSLVVEVLDPARKGVDGKQTENINSKIPVAHMAPGTEAQTFISVAGRENMNELLNNAISGKTMGTLIQQPWGCGEQNIISMTLPLIATMFLDTTKQWDTVGIEKREEAFKHIENGYKSELSYRKSDGSFAAFLHYISSTWLTAYVARVFVMAHILMGHDLPDLRNHVSDAMKFIILNRQQPDGVFIETGKVYSPAMIDDLHGAESDASLTAFCLISMQATQEHITVSSMADSKIKAVNYLERRLPNLKKPYSVAITSYALANENKLNQDILYRFAAPDRSHWPVPGQRLQSLEVTAYALLALIRAGEFEKAKPIVSWLNRQQRIGGTYGSTQATIMVYQAIAEYWANAKEPDYNLDVNIWIAGRTLTTNYAFDRGSFAPRTSKPMVGINKDIKVTANGTGGATVKVMSLYYALPEVKETHCQTFDMTLLSEEVSMSDGKKTYNMTIEFMFKNKERKSLMTILDISLPTAFTYNKADLDLLSQGHARTISKYESDTVMSERGSLIIYLESVSNVRTEVISFRMHQEMEVGHLQPTPVTIYEYNDARKCTKFYHPERDSGDLMKLCSGSVCYCAEENCSMQKKEKIDNKKRYAKACETTTTGRIDFVYKVRVEESVQNLTTDYYKMLILNAYKEGSIDVSPQDKVRTFLTHQHCREALGLMEGKTYLIMGTSEDIRDPSNPEFYLLGEKTWIEYWPTDTECQTVDAHRETCKGMELLITVFRGFGCKAK